MVDILWYLSFGVVILLIVSFHLKLGYHLSKNRKWIWWEFGISFMALFLSITELLVMTGI